MKITKVRLQEIIREEAQLELPGLGPPDACAPADDIENLSAQVASLILDSEFGIEEYGDIVDAAMDKIAEATPELGTAEEEEIEIGHEASGREYSGDYSNLGIKETIRRMVRETLGAPQAHERYVRSRKWALGPSDAPAVSAEVFGSLVRRCAWTGGPKEKALTVSCTNQRRGVSA